MPSTLPLTHPCSYNSSYTTYPTTSAVVQRYHEPARQREGARVIASLGNMSRHPTTQVQIQHQRPISPMRPHMLIRTPDISKKEMEKQMRGQHLVARSQTLVGFRTVDQSSTQELYTRFVHSQPQKACSASLISQPFMQVLPQMYINQSSRSDQFYRRLKQNDCVRCFQQKNFGSHTCLHGLTTKPKLARPHTEPINL